jgi:hypothetical protein
MRRYRKVFEGLRSATIKIGQLLLLNIEREALCVFALGCSPLNRERWTPVPKVMALEIVPTETISFLTSQGLWRWSEEQGMAYRCIASTIEGFIQQLAVCYVAHGYWFYVSGYVPEGKDPRAVDAKLIEKYEINISKWARARRKTAGVANIQYLRHERFFVLIATRGNHAFFQEERSSIKDCRETPIKFASYAVSYRGGHAHVRVERETFRDLAAYVSELALRRDESDLERLFRTIPFEPYAPVRNQIHTLLRAVNRKRKTAGLNEIPSSCVRYRRQLYKPFAELEGENAA